MAVSDGLGTLSKLPLELRKRCYEYHIGSCEVVLAWDGCDEHEASWEPQYDRNLLLVSKQVYEEARAAEKSVEIMLTLDYYDDALPQTLKNRTTHIHVDNCSWNHVDNKQWKGFPADDYPVLRKVSLSGICFNPCSLQALHGSVDDLMKGRLDKRIAQHARHDWEEFNEGMLVQDMFLVSTDLDLILCWSVIIKSASSQYPRVWRMVSDSITMLRDS